MDNILCSVVMSTYNRAHLLTRSLMCYEKQEFPKNLFELVIVDDGSNDDTEGLVKCWSHATGIRVTYLIPHPKTSEWRDCAQTINHGIRVSQGRHILLTHPEIMVGRTSVLECVTQLEEFEKRRIDIGPKELQSPIGLYACCKCYFLSPKDQTLLDTVNWREKGALAVRDIERFYEDDIGGHPDFSHRATDIVATPGARIPLWQSWQFGGHSRRTWKELGGMLPTTKWGACDVGWMHRRQVLGIENYTCSNESSIITHQNHDLPDDIKTPRIMEDWQRELGNMKLNNPNDLVYPIINELGW